MNVATYISRAEAAVRPRRAHDPVDVRGVQTLHRHVDQVLLQGCDRPNGLNLRPNQSIAELTSQLLTHEASFCNADIFFVFLQRRGFRLAKDQTNDALVVCNFTHLQEVSQHHVHVHVLLLPPTAHETQVLPAGDGARLQRLLLSLQERLHRQGKLRRVLEHLYQQSCSLKIRVCVLMQPINQASSSHQV